MYQLTRRGVLAPALICVLGLSAGERPPTRSAASAAATIAGVVFDDRNNDGQRQPDEPGLAGVGVSDGVTVVRTNERGEYRITTDPARRFTTIVFVTVPSGYRATAGIDMVPRFFRDLGALSDGASATANFALMQDPASRDTAFTFATMSDTHVSPDREEDAPALSRHFADVSGNTDHPRFLIITGDMTGGGGSSEFRQLRDAMATSRIPIMPVPGNHDLVDPPGIEYIPSDHRIQLEPYRHNFGPESYSFDYGLYHFVVLETNDPPPNDLGNLEKWLGADLEMNARGHKVVVLQHQPWNTPWTTLVAERLLAVLRPYPVTAMLSGHVHANFAARDSTTGSHGALYLSTTSTTGSLDFSPRGYRLISIGSAHFSPEFRMFDVRRQLVAVHPAPESVVAAESTTTVVNAYDASLRVRSVRIRIDSGTWQPLSPVGTFSWAAPWNAAKLTTGRHQMVVEAFDGAGQTWIKRGAFSVAPASAIARPHAGAGWTMFHGNAAHTGVATDDVPSGAVRLAWTYRTGGSFLLGSPVISDGTVYAAARDDNDTTNASVVAVDLATGHERWRVQSGASVGGTVAVDHGLVYAATLTGTLLALDANTGKQVWRHVFRPPGDVSRVWMYFSPTVAGDVVYQAYEVGRLDPTVKACSWSKQRDCFGASALGGLEARSFMAALDAKTGAVRWTSPLEQAYMNEASPAVVGNRVYVGARLAWLVTYNALTGKDTWRRQPLPRRKGGEMHSAPAVASGLVVMGYDMDTYVALDTAGNKRWDATRYQNVRFTTNDAGEPRADGPRVPNFMVASTPAVTDSTVYLGFLDGNVGAVRASTGEWRWIASTGGAVMSSPAVSGQTVYVGSDDGCFYAFDAPTGRVVWRYQIGSWVASSPAVSGNMIVVGAFDGNIYAFTSSTSMP